MKICRKAQGVVAAWAAAALLLPPALAQRPQESDAASALSAALGAACRGSEAQFANYLTAENAAAFLALPPKQRTALLKRFSLTDEPGKVLSSSDPQAHTVLRCEVPEQTVEFRFGNVRTADNLAFIPVSVVESQQTEFGLVRENGGWRLLSLGLLLLNIPELSKQWAAGEMAAQEDNAIAMLREIAEAVRTYRRAYGKLPDSLAQLGPAPQNEISPDQASLISAELAAGSAAGYHFGYRIQPAETDAEAVFELAATPDKYGKTGNRSFFVDGAGKIHGADKRGAVALPSDPLIVGEKAP